MSKITIINVFDGINVATYTFDHYYVDHKAGAGFVLGEDEAVATINSMANYWVQQHGGQYEGYNETESGYVVKNPQGEVAMIYYTQELTLSTAANKADSIV